MPKVDFYLVVTTKLELQLDTDIQKSKHMGCGFRINTSDNIDISKYHAEDGLPNAEGTDAVVKTLTSGLVAAIHAGHQRGYKNDAECLREVIKILEDQFILPAEISKGHM